MHTDCERILWIEKKFAGSVPVAVCNLKGSAIFFADVLRATNIDMEMDFMAVSSYGANAVSSGKPFVKRDLFSSVQGKDVILVEDIVDTGRTLVTLREFFKERGAKSVTVVALLDKPARRVVEAQADFVCFSVEDEFLVGYGLDYSERYRNLPYVGILKRSVYES